jgi:curved DNA-binding protein CbpA
VLGVDPSLDDKGILRQFRKLSSRFHPDKIRSEDPNVLAQAQRYYVILNEAQEILADPVKRYIYDRLGPAGIALKTNKKGAMTIKDYVETGATVYILKPYLGGALSFAAANMLGFVLTARYVCQFFFFFFLGYMYLLTPLLFF